MNLKTAKMIKWFLYLFVTSKITYLLKQAFAEHQSIIRWQKHCQHNWQTYIVQRILFTKALTDILEAIVKFYNDYFIKLK